MTAQLTPTNSAPLRSTLTGGANTAAQAEAARVAAFGAGTRSVRDNTIFADRVRLHFDTSFTGKDRLRARLQARNFTTFSGGVTGTNQTRLGFDNTNNNNLELNRWSTASPSVARLPPLWVVGVATVSTTTI
jgi:hypothetical protein